MQYFIGKNGQQLGPFGEEQIRARVASGEFSNSDLMWREGMASWEPIGTVLANPYLPTANLGASPLFAGRRPLAGLGARLGAVILDTLIAVVVAIPFFIGLAGMESSGGTPSGGSLALIGLGSLLLLGLMVFQLVSLSKEGQTLGKKMMKVRIVSYDNGSNPGFGRAVMMRGFLPGLIGGVPLLGMIFSLVDICFIFRADRRCIHDLMANTHVVEA